VIAPHRRLDGLIDAYVDGELDAHRTTRIGRHIAECARCRAVVETTRAIKHRLLHRPADRLGPGPQAR